MSLLPLINNLNSNLLILLGLPTNLLQKHNIYILISNSIGYRPSSPYPITFGVLVLTLKSFYKIPNEFYQYAIVFKPQISAELIVTH